MFPERLPIVLCVLGALGCGGRADVGPDASSRPVPPADASVPVAPAAPTSTLERTAEGCTATLELEHGGRVARFRATESGDPIEPCPDEAVRWRLLSALLGDVGARARGSIDTFVMPSLLPERDASGLRLALAGAHAPDWDPAAGRPRGDLSSHAIVTRLANEAHVFAELEEAFRTHALTIRVGSVEKVVTPRAEDLPFADRLIAARVPRSAKLPSALVWIFAVAAP